jgi:peptidase M23-like protein
LCLRLSTVIVSCLALVAPSSALAYQWPLKPFHRQHPIRGAFGDPRTLRGGIDVTFDNPVSFHDGVDIQARDGTPVYAVESGFVSSSERNAIAVGSPFALPTSPVVFGYWHIDPVVKSGQYVQRSQLLGYVHTGQGHVHLSERRFGIYVNPVRRDGLAPYADHTYPVIRGLIVYAAATDRELPLDAVTGRVDIAVDAYDPPAMRPLGEWSDAIWSPAHITWSGVFNFESAWMPRSGPAQTVDFDRLPHVALRDVYAPGTTQNQPGSRGDDRFWLVRGLDTSDLVGDHEITVTASDTRSNLTTRTFTLTVTG